VTLTWTTQLAAADLGRLARRCHAADGGLKMVVSADFLARRWAGDHPVITAVNPAGSVVAAGSLREPGVFTGLIDPEWRGHGLGSHVLDWALSSGKRPLTVEAESLTPDASALFVSRGLRRTFAEDVLGIDLSRFPIPVSWPAETKLLAWSPEIAPRFHAVYEAAFRERPGFPGLSAAAWIGEVGKDVDFRPHCSLLVVVDGIGDAGFITSLTGWIDQVGVAPAARGLGLGAALVGEALNRLRLDGSAEAGLCVNVDNRAGRLYRRLGFQERGRRARFTSEDQS
jgi:mycothiol synthase